MTQDLDIQLVRALMPDQGTPDRAARDHARARLLNAAAGPRPRPHRRLAPHRRLPLPARGRLLAGLAVLVVGGGVATAATVALSGRSVDLVARSISCANGTPKHETSQWFDVNQDGRTPQAACAAVMHVSASDLVVCTSRRFGVNVFERGGGVAVADECGSAGMTPGVPAGYARATARVAALQRDLNDLYASRNCFTVAGLEAGTRAVLDRLGFTGWRVITARQAFPHADASPSTGNCGQYQGSGNSQGSMGFDATGSNNEVIVESGPSRVVLKAMANPALFKAPPTRAARCTVAGVEGYTAAILRHGGATGSILFALRSKEAHTQLADDGRQARYSAGCPVFVGVGTAPNGTTLLVELWQRGAPRERPGGSLPASAYAKPVAH